MCDASAAGFMETEISKETITSYWKVSQTVALFQETLEPTNQGKPNGGRKQIYKGKQVYMYGMKKKSRKTEKILVCIGDVEAEVNHGYATIFSWDLPFTS